MNTTTETRSVVVERLLPHAPAKVFRALTEPHLIAEWLMASDFAPVVGHSFRFLAAWGAVDCKVLAMEENRMLSYSWVSTGLESVVTWTLTPSGAGTHLRMEQVGFQPDQKQAYAGAQHGWANFVGRLEGLLARQD